MSDAAGGLTQVAAQPIAGPADKGPTDIAPAASPVEAVSRLAQATVAVHVAH
jgi:hypothetical protein